MNRSGTGVLIVITGIVLLSWEILAFVTGSRRALLSTWFQKLGFRSPIAILVIGMLLGHFWMYFPPTLDDEKVDCPHCGHSLTLTIDEETGGITTSKK